MPVQGSHVNRPCGVCLHAFMAYMSVLVGTFRPWRIFLIDYNTPYFIMFIQHTMKIFLRTSVGCAVAAWAQNSGGVKTHNLCTCTFICIRHRMGYFWDLFHKNNTTNNRRTKSAPQNGLLKWLIRTLYSTEYSHRWFTVHTQSAVDLSLECSARRTKETRNERV